MSKKPASPKPAPEIPGAPSPVDPHDMGEITMESTPTPEDMAAVLDRVMPGETSVESMEIEDHLGVISIDIDSVTRKEFDALKARVDALCTYHLQAYGKAI